MSGRLEYLALEKQVLVQRSALCRLRLHRDANALRQSLQWPRAALALVPSVGRVLLYLRLARSVIRFVGRLTGRSS